MNDCDNFLELFSCAKLAYHAGDFDAKNSNPIRSTKKLEDLMQGFAYRKGHLDFIRHAYRMGLFNNEMQLEATR